MNTLGWANSLMRKDLNGYTTSDATQSGAISGLGANLNNKSYIKQVKKKYIATYNVASSVTTCNDYLWLLASSEIVNSGFKSGYYGYAVASEGNQYKYYQEVIEEWNKANTNLIKKGSETGTESSYWFLRSPWYADGESYCAVNYLGHPGAQVKAKSSRGVAPGFCI